MPTVPTPPLTLTITGDNGLRDEIEATTEAIRDFWALLRPWIDRAEGLLAAGAVAEVKWADANADEAWPPSSYKTACELFRSVLGTAALYDLVAEISKVDPDAGEKAVFGRTVDRPVCELQPPELTPASADADYSATLEEIRRNLPEDRAHLIYRLDGLVGERMLQAAEDEARSHRRMIEGLVAVAQSFLDNDGRL